MDPLYFRENESRGEEAIVFVHGGGISGRLWQSTLKALPEYHCLAPDLPGFGKSDHITPFSSESAADGLAHLIRFSVPSGRAAVVGFSVGAVVCIGLFNRHPDLVEKAFLSGPTPRLSRGATTMMNAIARLFLPLTGRQHIARLVARSMGLTDNQVDAFQQDLDQLTIDLFTQVNDVVAGQSDPRPNSLPAFVFAGERELGAVKKRAHQLTKALGSGLGLLSGEYAIFAFGTRPEALLRLKWPAAWLSEWTLFVAYGLIIVLLPQLFPTGRPLSLRWRLVFRLSLAYLALFTVLLAFAKGSLEMYLAGLNINNPYGLISLGGLNKETFISPKHSWQWWMRPCSQPSPGCG